MTLNMIPHATKNYFVVSQGLKHNFRNSLKEKVCAGQLVNKVTGHWLGWGSVPCRQCNSSLGHHIQTGSETHPAYYPVDARGCFLAGKAIGRVADHLITVLYGDEFREALRHEDSYTVRNVQG